MTVSLKKFSESIRDTNHEDRITGSLESLAKVDQYRAELDERLRAERRAGKDLPKEARDMIKTIVDNEVSALGGSLLKLNLLLSMLEEQRSAHPGRDLTLDQMIAEADAILERALSAEKHAAELIESVDDLCEKLPQGPPGTQAAERSA
jgi:predicted ester cyclase